MSDTKHNKSAIIAVRPRDFLPCSSKECVDSTDSSGSLAGVRIPVLLRWIHGSLLKETGVGKTVNSLRKHELVGDFAKDLVARWKKLVPVAQEAER